MFVEQSWPQALISTRESFFTHTRGHIASYSVDGELRWINKTPRAMVADDVQNLLYQPFPPAHPFEVEAGRLTFFRKGWVGLFDAQSGDPIRLSSSSAKATWREDTVSIGSTTLTPVGEQVTVANDEGNQTLSDAELYTCRDSSIAFIVTPENTYIVEATGALSEQPTLRPIGLLAGYFLDEKDRLQVIWFDGRALNVPDACWTVERPTEYPEKAWGDPAHGEIDATATKAGIGAHLHFRPNKEHFGPMLFFPFEDERDVWPCRRRTNRPVLPDGARVGALHD